MYNPKSRINFWQKKFRDNIVREKKVEQKLVATGYRVFTI